MECSDSEDGLPSVQSVDEDDEFWEAETYDGEEMSSEEIDEILYG